MEWKKINRYIIYLISLFIISLGASLSIKANLGTSPLICLPYVCSLITNLSVGIVIFLFTILFIVIQIALLGKGFEKRQYLQLVIGFIFSFFVDFSLMIVNFINPIGYINQFLLLLFSCLVVAFGVLLEIQTEVVYLPADVEYVSYWDVTVKGGYISFNFELEDLNRKHMELADVSVAVAMDKSGNIQSLFERAHEYYMQHEKFANLKLISLFYRITYAIFKEIDRKNYKEKQTAHEIYKAMVYLNDNYMSKVTTEELATMCNVS